MASTAISRTGVTGKLERLAAPQSEVEAFLVDVASGTSPSDAARKFTRQDGRLRTSSEFGRLANRDSEFATRYADALAERDLLMADKVDDVVQRRALEEDAPAPILMGWAGRWNAGYRWRERQQVTLDGGKISDALTGIDPTRYTEAQLEQLEFLLLVGAGRIANPDLPTLDVLEAGTAA